jgi:hypothetical protein
MKPTQQTACNASLGAGPSHGCDLTAVQESKSKSHSRNKRRSVRSLQSRYVSSLPSYNDHGYSPQPVCSTRTVALSRLVLLDTLQDEAQ